MWLYFLCCCLLIMRNYLFGKAYRRSATMNNALSGFEKTGIWPFNPNIFPDWTFQPAATTDRPIESTDNQKPIMKSQPKLGVSRASIVYRETDGNQKDLESIEALSAMILSMSMMLVIPRYQGAIFLHLALRHLVLVHPRVPQHKQGVLDHLRV